MSEHWENLIKALQLLGKHEDGPYPFHCEHDELFVMSDPKNFTAEELAELDGLGFFPNDVGTFSSFRYGSA